MNRVNKKEFINIKGFQIYPEKSSSMIPNLNNNNDNNISNRNQNLNAKRTPKISIKEDKNNVNDFHDNIYDNFNIENKKLSGNMNINEEKDSNNCKSIKNSLKFNDPNSITNASYNKQESLSLRQSDKDKINRISDKGLTASNINNIADNSNKYDDNNQKEYNSISDEETEMDIELYAESEQILNFKNSLVEFNLSSIINKNNSNINRDFNNMTSNKTKNEFDYEIENDNKSQVAKKNINKQSQVINNDTQPNRGKNSKILDEEPFRQINKNNSDFNLPTNNYNYNNNIREGGSKAETSEKNTEVRAGFKKLIKKKFSDESNKKENINRKIINNAENDFNNIRNGSFSDYDENKNIDIKKINVHQSAIANNYNIKIGDVDLNEHFYKEKISTLEEENKHLKERLRSVNNYCIFIN